MSLVPGEGGFERGFGRHDLAGIVGIPAERGRPERVALAADRLGDPLHHRSLEARRRLLRQKRRHAVEIGLAIGLVGLQPLRAEGLGFLVLCACRERQNRAFGSMVGMIPRRG